MTETNANNGDKSFSKYLNEDLIIINPSVSSKEELFERMVNHLYNLDIIINRNEFLRALTEREKMASTELLPGIALPHACSDSVHRVFVSIVILKDGIDYENPEMGDANIIFFFGSSDKQNKEYLQLLAKASRLLNIKDFRNKLISAETREDVFNIIKEYDSSQKSIEGHSHFLSIITIYDNKILSKLLTSMVELGITNGSIIEGTSLAKKISYEMPIFAGLSYMRFGKNKESTVIICHIKDKNQMFRLKDILCQYNIDFNKPGTGNIQIIKVDDIIGIIDESIEL